MRSGIGIVIKMTWGVRVFLMAVGLFVAQGAEAEDLFESIDHVVRIQNRQFIPHVLHLRVGQSTRLILKNEDTELHAFVPDTLFVRANVQVSGNGAPQFGEQGFRRVLLPTSGQTELVFAPKQAGSYAFFCDLPGHVMNGTVVVEE